MSLTFHTCSLTVLSSCTSSVPIDVTLPGSMSLSLIPSSSNNVSPYVSSGTDSDFYQQKERQLFEYQIFIPSAIIITFITLSAENSRHLSMHEGQMITKGK